MKLTQNSLRTRKSPKKIDEIKRRRELTRTKRNEEPKRPDHISLSKETKSSETSKRVSRLSSGLAKNYGAEESSDSKTPSRRVEGGAEGIFDFLPFVGDDDKDSRLAEDRDKDATVAVIDYFADEGKEAKHGDKVESILQDTHGDLTDQDIQRYRAGGGGNINDVVNAEADDIGDALDGYVEDRLTGLLDGSSDAFEDILDQDDSKIRTVNQSLGAPEIRVAQDLYGKLGENEEFRDRFLEYSGLESDASEKEILQTLVDEVSDSRRNNENIEEAQERYDDLTSEARQRGITTVVSSGNYGKFADTLAQHDVKVDDEFYNDVLVNGDTISVGAIDDKGTADTTDDTEAKLTTPNAGTDLSADGVGVSTTIDGKVHTGDGTSFAAPQVAGAAAAIAEQNPELSPAQIQAVLEHSAENTGLDTSEVGAGLLDFDEALEVAENFRSTPELAA